MTAADMGALLAAEEIKRVKARYFRYVDTKDWQGLVDVFSKDGILDISDAKGPADIKAIHQGAENIVDFIRGFIEDKRSVHHGHCHEVTILSQYEARGIIAMEDIVMDESGANLIMHGWGHYTEKYVKEDGKWRIANSKLTRLHMMTNFPAMKNSRHNNDIINQG